ncbi:hypothetical protein Gbfr_042_114 [Gluconobacter frateurii M-2]|nr:hypothetical protein Gbfr_042_114 [Gluconobacter frateurii M-2]
MGADRAIHAQPQCRGRPREIEFREVINALGYLFVQAATGGGCPTSTETASGASSRMQGSIVRR